MYESRRIARVEGLNVVKTAYKEIDFPLTSSLHNISSRQLSNIKKSAPQPLLK